jgi:hypothetical protein
VSVRLASKCERTIASNLALGDPPGLAVACRLDLAVDSPPVQEAAYLPALEAASPPALEAGCLRGLDYLQGLAAGSRRDRWRALHWTIVESVSK